MLEHGGRLLAAAARYGIAAEDWLDLSTGIAPYAYPVPPIPSAVWQRLPEDEDGLAAVACRYYGVRRVLPLPGSQAAIQALPRLRAPGVALVPEPSYAEYAAAWSAAGHRVRRCAADDLLQVSTTADAVVIGNPNNPTGRRFSRSTLLDLARQLDARGGWLIVDEAFADAEEESESLADLAGSEAAGNLVVLRSLGKFFGLAGARVGFAIAADSILDQLAEAIGPWALAHPSRHAARAALADGAWQAAQRARLQRDSARLQGLLAAADLGDAGGTALFRYLPRGDARELHEFFARQGILLRHFAQPAAVRVGLPATEADWQRLAATLELWKRR
ncbi:threonine-phosphate decarboxylase CobD [Sulfuritalea sp.]|uniref:threonine-phosphate decarboxylase CobD n=1 Tax=Sulfuritalea sp. TaxID=2480090 RepID=UPI00286DB958|nr:threonine-phosphate decarboxylase CobD [Sulfuritalea sp.]